MRNKPLAKIYSLAEEIANSVSHGVGGIFGIVGLILMLNQAGEAGANALAVTSYSLYGGSMILLYLTSTLYHAIPHPPAKRWLQKLDHCAIYLLIAGTYTLFLLICLASPLAKWLMVVIYVMAAVGIIFKLVFSHRFRAISISTYFDYGLVIAGGHLSAGAAFTRRRRGAAGGRGDDLFAGGGFLRLGTDTF